MRAVKPIEEDAPLVTSRAALRAAENACRRCPLYRTATQAVPGEGPRRARIMLVGEQPGTRRISRGSRSSVRRGAFSDQALGAAGIPRGETFVTNAVKHFKHEQRGKRRLHKRPNAYEIERCKWWLERERALVRPALIVALGATAARSLIGRVTTIGQVRGQALVLADGTALTVTIHPSALLRIREDKDRRAEYAQFVTDLKIAARMVFGKAA